MHQRRSASSLSAKDIFAYVQPQLIRIQTLQFIYRDPSYSLLDFIRSECVISTTTNCWLTIICRRRNRSKPVSDWDCSNNV
ncbi:hypothetical protein MIMGU_mgv11b014512mg [Erythranthe guttata]|uniref:Uncharacterized protein n=1 Tax=Erythranthe guttata TaxID=4155 RepID=A0A022R8R1_ERYGU|nr:hypothetical protein MIMGU_mgv11b014512mg [Erythranthe guttata]